MAISSIILIEVKKNERTYGFNIPVGAPFGEAYDAAYEVLQDVLRLANQAAENAKAQTPVEIVTEDSSTDEQV